MPAKVKVTLIGGNEDPVAHLYQIWTGTREPLFTPNETPFRVDEAEELFERLLLDGVPVLEHVHVTFCLDNVSISLREQLVRHRIGMTVDGRVGVDMVPDLASSSWWSQSMRVLPMEDFYLNEEFMIPESVRDQECGEVTTLYCGALSKAQEVYRALIECGIPAEDARNVLPLATTSRIFWTLNLSTLRHVVGKRGCWILQSSLWKDLIEGLIEQLIEQVHPVFANLVCPPCLNPLTDEFKGCLFPLDNDRRCEGTDPLPACPLYLEHHNAQARVAINRTPGSPYSVHPENGAILLRNKTDQEATFVDGYQRMKVRYSQMWRRDPVTGVSWTKASPTSATSAD